MRRRRRRRRHRRAFLISSLSGFLFYSFLFSLSPLLSFYDSSSAILRRVTAELCFEQLLTLARARQREREGERDFRYGPCLIVSLNFNF